jgi:hypothetical protein
MPLTAIREKPSVRLGLAYCGAAGSIPTASTETGSLCLLRTQSMAQSLVFPYSGSR